MWFDSLGAKSSCVFVETPDVRILIDPGVAIMHPSFPASWEDKVRWAERARDRIHRYARRADVIIVSHYHYDHHLREPELYQGKLLLAKNPNEYINDSQRKRAEYFFGLLWNTFAGTDIPYRKPSRRSFPDYANRLSSIRRDFGDYTDRRRQLLASGKQWFGKRAEKWRQYPYIPEGRIGDTQLVYPEGKTLVFGRTYVRCIGPLFHGIEYSRVGWVFLTVIEHRGVKLLHSSDLNGPIIEDYADLIIDEDPDILFLDGPMTYMLGYTLNLINFRRTLANAKRIVEEADFRLMIWDHHLPREPLFRHRTREVWDTANQLGKTLLTAAEVLNKTPVVEQALQ